MTSISPDQWTSHTRHTLKRYDETLLRQLAHRLCKPRNQWPVSELLERVVTALNNAAMIDRRLKELPAACRQILAIIGQSRQNRWPVGSLVEIVVALGHEDGLAPLVTLLESGLLLPELHPLGTSPDEEKSSVRARLKSVTTWLSRTEPPPMLLASPQVTRRVHGEDLGIVCPVAPAPEGKLAIHEADGLEWPLRMAVLWQQALGAPLRRTQQGGFFKRDHDRLQADPLLSAAPTDALTLIPDPGFFTAALATSAGMLREEDAELRAGDWPADWKSPLPHAVLRCWHALHEVRAWNPGQGYVVEAARGNPYPAAYLLSLLLLSRLADDEWASPQAIEEWIAARHPYWAGSKRTDEIGIAAFLLGIAYSLRLVQAIQGDAGAWLLRLSSLGRWVAGQTEAAPTIPAFKQTLLVQPNLEILAYRQGLTPELIAQLSKIATWRTLGPACTLLLEPHSVYRALEMGESQASILQLFDSHGMKAVPPAVLDSLKTWSSKRERLSVYPAGAIFEFGTPAEMEEAITRGLPAVRLTDRLAIVPNESEIAYKNFRLTGTRDYTLPPEKCVDVDADGVTLHVDLAKSDLLLETELQRFAEPDTEGMTLRAAGAGRRAYRIKPASIASARKLGLTLSYLETWFSQRTGLPISAAALLFMTAPQAGPVDIRRQLILHVANEHLADGLQQWPSTRALVQARIGPTALVVTEDDLTLLMERLKELGVEVRWEV
ncbi:MAG: hypothetical protein HYX68_09170 [Planctomycetes bacterium]|nr:hypothetical protein [Planctomycetota bacterium]